MSLPLPASMDRPDTVKVPDSGWLTLHAVVRPVDAASFAGRIPPGTGSVSLFLVNERIPSTDRDESFAFQTEIEVRSVAPYECGRMPGTRGRDREDQTVCRVARRPGLAPS